MSPFTLTQCDRFFPHLRRAALITSMHISVINYCSLPCQFWQTITLFKGTSPHINLYQGSFRCCQDGDMVATATLPASAESKAYGLFSGLFLCCYGELPTCNSHRSVQTTTSGSNVSRKRNKTIQTLKNACTHQSAATQLQERTKLTLTLPN